MKPPRPRVLFWREVFDGCFNFLTVNLFRFSNCNLANGSFTPAKLSFKMEEQIKCLPDKVKLKESIINKPLLYEMLKGII